MRQTKFTIFLTEFRDSLLEISGSRYKSICELFSKGIPFPPSFLVTSDCFKYFLDFTDIKKSIEKMIKDKLVNRRRIEKLVLDSKIPPIISSEINDCYKRICGLSQCNVLLIPYLFREQITYPTEDEKIRHVYGGKNLEEVLIKIWSSAIVNNIDNISGILSGKLKVSVIVEKFPLEEVSGICYTSDVITKNKDHVVIEATYGNWDIVEKEGMLPDQYIYSKKSQKIVDKHISRQDYMLLKHLKRKDTTLERVNVSSVWQTRQKIDDKHLKSLAKIAHVIENHFGEPCEIRWIFEAGRIWILSVDSMEKISLPLTPITSISVEPPKPIFSKPEVKIPTVPIQTPSKPKVKKITKKLSKKEFKGFEPTLRGEGNNEGVIKGIVVKSKDEINRYKNSIWVVSKIYDDDIEHIHNVSGLIIDNSTENDAAMAVSKMHGIPTITSTALASKVLKTGQVILLDSNEGTIYTSVSAKSAEKTEELAPVYVSRAVLSNLKFDRTATKVVVLSKPTMVTKWAKISNLYDGLIVGPITSNLSFNEYIQELITISKPIWLSIEKNSELGTIAKELRDFRLKNRVRNLYVILPSFSTKEEVIEAKKTLLDNGLRRSSTFQIMIKVDKPIHLLNTPDLISAGCDGIWIDGNTLQTELIGEKRKTLSNEVTLGLTRIIQDALHQGINSYLCLQPSALNKKTVRTFVETGIYSIAVPDIETLVALRNIIGEIEREKITGRLYSTAGSQLR